MSEMTLKQVRDILRNAGRFDIYGTNEQACDLADAIDAHLTCAPGQVTDEMVERVIAKVTRETSMDGMDGDTWDRLLVRESLSARPGRVSVSDGEIDRAMTEIRRALQTTNPSYACVGISTLNEWLELFESLSARLAQPVENPVPRLNAHARIGGTIFGPGVKWSVVIGRAQREYEWREQEHRRQQAAQGCEPVGHVYDSCPASSSGFSLMVHSVARLPNGTKLYAHPDERAAVPEGIKLAIERCLRSEEGFADRIDKENPGDEFASLAVRDDIDAVRQWLSATPTLAGKEG